VLLAEEGINLFLAGSRQGIDSLWRFLASDPRLTDLIYKESESREIPFNRLLVKIKREIIPLGLAQIRPAQQPAPRLQPEELKRWLDQGRDFVLLDTRNAFEVRVGTFVGAIDLGLGQFREFPQAAAGLAAALKQKPVVTFCTGGIRCEKAAPALLLQGFREVYQLDGGILRYFERCGGAHYAGECFVFDKRVAVDSALRETATTQCYVCQGVLSAADQQSPLYAEGKTCPYCAPLAAAGAPDNAV
jgi:predicted sulfurtransferase